MPFVCFARFTRPVKDLGLYIFLNERLAIARRLDDLDLPNSRALLRDAGATFKSLRTRLMDAS